MATFDARMVSLAQRLTSKFGESLTFTRVTQGAYDASDGTTATPTTTNYTANAVPQDYTEFERALESVQQDDVRLCVEKSATDPTEPLVGDTVALDSITYKIVNVGKMTTRGVDVMYILQCRV